MRKPNDVGVGWRQTNDRGEYLSFKLDLEELLKMLDGVVVETVAISAYPVTSDNPRAPNYQLKFYPKAGTTQRVAPAAGGPTQDDIPF